MDARHRAGHDGDDVDDIVMNLGISFAPLVPAYVVWAAFAVAVLIALILLIARSRGAPLRALALALMVLALANPSLTREDRDPIPSVAAVIVDKSPSQNLSLIHI